MNNTFDLIVFKSHKIFNHLIQLINNNKLKKYHDLYFLRDITVLLGLLEH